MYSGSIIGAIRWSHQGSSGRCGRRSRGWARPYSYQCRPSRCAAADRERNAVERLINRLKGWRRIATRYEKRAANNAAMLLLGCILLWR
jgi:transposase